MDECFAGVFGGKSMTILTGVCEMSKGVQTFVDLGGRPKLVVCSYGGAFGCKVDDVLTESGVVGSASISSEGLGFVGDMQIRSSGFSVTGRSNPAPYVAWLAMMDFGGARYAAGYDLPGQPWQQKKIELDFSPDILAIEMSDTGSVFPAMMKGKNFELRNAASQLCTLTFADDGFTVTPNNNTYDLPITWLAIESKGREYGG